VDVARVRAALVADLQQLAGLALARTMLRAPSSVLDISFSQ
jgi:hypothetical protein